MTRHRKSTVVGRTPWTAVCRFDDLEVERGVAALVNGHAVAIFRTPDDRVFALANQDPFSRSGVLARGIVGTRGEVPIVGSPTHRQSFDLRTGVCMDDPHVSVAVYQVEVVDGLVHIGPRSAP